MSNDFGPELDQLLVGDVIEFRSEIDERIIINVYFFTEEPYEWVEYELEPRSSHDREFLEVELDDGEWDVTHYTRHVLPEEIGWTSGNSLSEEVVLDGQSYFLVESGEMTVRKLNTRLSWNGTYADYGSDDGNLVLSIERYPSETQSPKETEIEIWQGRQLNRRSLTIYPAESAEPRQSRLEEVDEPPQTAISQLREHEAFQPVERRYNTLTNSAQRWVVAGGIGAVIVILIILAILL